MSDAPRQPAAPETDAIQQALDRIYMQCNTPTVDGHIYATTERAGHNRDTFAIAIVTTEGKIYSAGAVEEQFALQSISKVFSYGLALEDHGRDRVLEKVGVEPTGQRYNAINLHQSTGRPYNPMVNAGALAIADLIKGADITERLNRIIAAFSKYAGRRLLVDAPTFTFEFDTDHRNRAIAHLMAGQGVLEGKIDDVLYLYLQHCSLLVNTVELAAMAATFANSGVQP
ncbi:MAG: glutaminase, partial [Chloroflexota bacterium]